MNTKALELAIAQIMDKRMQLGILVPEAPDYYRCKQELHTLEQHFQHEHGKQVKEILLDVYDELTPDTPINEPLDYIAKTASAVRTGPEGKIYEVDATQGAAVYVDDYPHKPTRLVLLPNPLRVQLNVDARQQEVVWHSKKGVALSY